MKRCRACGKRKAEGGFYASPKMKGGRLNVCKECYKRKVREHRILHLEKARAYDRDRSTTDKRKKHNAENARAWRLAHPEEYYAQNKANNALRDGKIERKTKCEICGEGGVLHKHHMDYSKPLEVLWLCVSCHNALKKKAV